MNLLMTFTVLVLMAGKEVMGVGNGEQHAGHT